MAIYLDNCPCGGEVEYDAHTQSVVCPLCGAHPEPVSPVMLDAAIETSSDLCKIPTIH
jgi:hypothetical protein